MKEKSLNAMKKNQNLANKIWEIAYPVLMYYAAISIGMFLAQMIFGTENENYMICKIMASLVAIPVVWTDYKRDLMLRGEYGKKPEVSVEIFKNTFFVAVIALLLSVSLNNIICMSPLVSMSQEFKDASAAFYGSTIWLELIGSAIITPILEEMLHRGVVYGRLRKMMGVWSSIIVSALIFAVLHFNIVQFIYAFLLGVVFALFVEKTGKLYPAIVAHIAANTLAVIRTETGILQDTVNGRVSAWLISVGILLVGLGLLLGYCGIGTKKAKEERNG